MDLKEIEEELIFLEKLANDEHLWVWTLQPNIVKRVDEILIILKNSTERKLQIIAEELNESIQEDLTNPQNHLIVKLAKFLENSNQNCLTSINKEESFKWQKCIIDLCQKSNNLHIKEVNLSCWRSYLHIILFFYQIDIQKREELIAAFKKVEKLYNQVKSDEHELASFIVSVIDLTLDESIYLSQRLFEYLQGLRLLNIKQLNYYVAKAALSIGLEYSTNQNWSKSEYYLWIAYNHFISLNKINPSKHLNDIAFTAYNLGAILTHQNKLDEALDSSIFAFNTYSKLSPNNSEEVLSAKAHCASNIGAIFSNQNKFKQADKYFKKSYDLFIELNKKNNNKYDIWVAHSIYNISTLYVKQSNWLRAKKTSKESYILFKNLNIKYPNKYEDYIAYTAYNYSFGLSYNLLFSQALKYMEIAYTKFTKLDQQNPGYYTGDCVRSIQFLGNIYFNLSNYSDALLYSKISEKLDPKNFYNARLYALCIQSLSYFKLQDYINSIKKILKALNELDAERNNIPNAKDRKKFQSKYTTLFETVQFICLDDKVRYYFTAFFWHSHKARTISEQIIAGHSGSQVQPLPSLKVARPQKLALSLRKALDSGQSESRPLLVSYSFTGRDRFVVYMIPLWQVEAEQELPLYVKQISLPDDSIRQLFLALSRTYWLDRYLDRGRPTSSTEEPRISGHLYRRRSPEQPEILSHEDFDASTGDKERDDPPWWDQELDDAKYRLWKAASNAGLSDEWDQASFSWPSNRGIIDFNLKDSRFEFLEFAREKMHQWAIKTTAKRIVQPWIDELGKLDIVPSEVLLEPHGLLHVLPLQAAPVAWPSGQSGQPAPLASQIPVRITPAANLAVHLLDVNKQTTANPGGLLIAGPPRGSGLDEDKKERTLFFQWVPDPHRLEDHEMTLEQLQRQLDENPPRALHLITHGVFDGQNPMDSYIELDGQKLTAEELLQGALNLKGVQLVYLSSCEGTYAEGDLSDEVMGLVYGLLAAGARCVIGYLCPVLDNRSQEIAEQFYRHWLGEGLTAEQAYGRTLGWLHQNQPKWLQGDASGWMLHGDGRVEWKHE